ncbi:MAG: DUF3048 domain-containing protein [Candidatus Spechtbacterales bacterium]|nr:DUF3048 domain-containing protein [Candidatus Spechtbacterales bacterium]
MKIYIKKLKEALEHPIIFLPIILLILAFGGLFYFGEITEVLSKKGFYSFEINSGEGGAGNILNEPHPLTGKRCGNSEKRPFAVMMPSDQITRPLSGIAKADLVVEMPVTQPGQGGINRMMAVFACEEPEEIGSVRSARDDFIPLAASFDAIYAHWGGSHFALDELKKGIIPDIDALVNPFSTYYRKQWIARPHNGFTSFNRLLNTSEKLGFRTENKFGGYPHIEGSSSVGDNPTTISVAYPGSYRVSYVYNPENNSYMRWRGGSPEVDALDNKQVESKILIVMKTNTRHLEGQYNDVDVFGSGQAYVFQNGELIRASWQKEYGDIDGKLYFYNKKDKEIKFVAGNMWIHVVDNSTPIYWGGERL